jgi:hypothetical protein
MGLLMYVALSEVLLVQSSIPSMLKVIGHFQVFKTYLSPEFL